jgi:hypothetical protein
MVRGSSAENEIKHLLATRTDLWAVVRHFLAINNELEKCMVYFKILVHYWPRGT